MHDAVGSQADGPPDAVSGPFLPPVTFPLSAGCGPYSLTIDELDADGFVDVAVVCMSADKVAVLMNKTAYQSMTPAFAPEIDLPTGTSPVAIAVGDFNGDGTRDFAVTNSLDDTVSVILNQTTTPGSPIFASKVDFATGSHPFAIVASDLNRDGKPDLAVTTQTGISVLFNTTASRASTPTFAAKVDLTSAASFGLASGDLNGDNTPDLVSLDPTNNSAVVWANQTATGAATPTFSSPIEFAVGTMPQWVGVADYTYDLKLEIVALNFASNDVSVLENTTTGSGSPPTFAAHVDYPVGSHPTSATFRYLDSRDSRAFHDIATANEDGNSFSLLTGTGSFTATGAFGPSEPFSTPPIRWIASESINDDSWFDIVAAGPQADQIVVLLNAK
jgi:hypothetical protein